MRVCPHAGPISRAKGEIPCLQEGTKPDQASLMLIIKGPRMCCTVETRILAVLSGVALMIERCSAVRMLLHMLVTLCNDHQCCVHGPISSLAIRAALLAPVPSILICNDRRCCIISQNRSLCDVAIATVSSADTYKSSRPQTQTLSIVLTDMQRACPPDRWRRSGRHAV